jgi:hypothetical protein
MDGGAEAKEAVVEVPHQQRKTDAECGGADAAADANAAPEGDPSCCRICLAERADDPHRVDAPCRHLFCGACLDQWCARQRAPVPCPLCKQPFNQVVRCSDGAARPIAAAPEGQPLPHEEEADLSCLDHAYFLGEAGRLARRAASVRDRLVREACGFSSGGGGGGGGGGAAYGSSPYSGGGAGFARARSLTSAHVAHMAGSYGRGVVVIGGGGGSFTGGGGARGSSAGGSLVGGGLAAAAAHYRRRHPPSAQQQQQQQASSPASSWSSLCVGATPPSAAAAAAHTTLDSDAAIGGLGQVLLALDAMRSKFGADPPRPFDAREALEDLHRLDAMVTAAGTVGGASGGGAGAAATAAAGLRALWESASGGGPRRRPSHLRHGSGDAGARAAPEQQQQEDEGQEEEEEDADAAAAAALAAAEDDAALAIALFAADEDVQQDDESYDSEEDWDDDDDDDWDDYEQAVVAGRTPGRAPRGRRRGGG